jgi:hypothetical protein
MNLENIHKNKKLAFLDGLLSGIALTLIGMAFRKDVLEEREWTKRREASKHIHPSAR